MSRSARCATVADTIATGLGGHKAGSGWVARCPSDEDPTLSLSLPDADDGKALGRCEACCGPIEAIAQLRSRSLWAQNAVRSSRSFARRAVSARTEPAADNSKRTEPAVSVDPSRSSDACPQPKPITTDLKSVAALYADTLLPNAPNASVIDEADRMPCPPEFITSAALVALGSTVRAGYAIEPSARDSWSIVPYLSNGIVGDRAIKKSPACGVALKPLYRLNAKAAEKHCATRSDYQTARVVFDARTYAFDARIPESVRKASEDAPNVIARELRVHRGQAPDRAVSQLDFTPCNSSRSYLAPGSHQSSTSNSHTTKEMFMKVSEELQSNYLSGTCRTRHRDHRESREEERRARRPTAGLQDPVDVRGAVQAAHSEPDQHARPRQSVWR